MSSEQIQQTLDQLFRRESGRITAHLTRFLGPRYLDLAENVVQEALLRAVKNWQLNGIPDEPGAWLIKVAKNIAIDQIRSVKFLTADAKAIDLAEDPVPLADSATSFANEISDDQLKLMFICAHPQLALESRIALTLKTVCGFSVKEIAKSYLSKEETIAQRLIRAKQKIAKSGLRYEMPAPHELEERLDGVLDVLYLLFNEGYLATEGDALIRRDLCEEAIYRTHYLANHPVCARPQVHALLALMYFQFYRFDARVDTVGEVLLLEEQDRTLSEPKHIAQGLYHLECSAGGDHLSRYHLEAGVASCHAIATSFASTDWQQILVYYDLLLARQLSPVVALNRAVVIAMIDGPHAGLQEIERITNFSQLTSYYLLYATQAELHRRNGNLNAAKSLYETALSLAGTAPQRRHLQKRIDTCAAVF